MAAFQRGRTASVLKSDVLKEGWLIKSPPLSRVDATSRKKWRRRFFTLKTSMRKLYYYTDASMKELKGEIDLRECSKVKCKLEHPKYKNVFSCVCPHREYYLSADTDEDMLAWAETIAGIGGSGQGGGAGGDEGGAADGPAAPAVEMADGEKAPGADAVSRASTEIDDDFDPDDYVDPSASTGPSVAPPPPPPPPAAATAAAAPAPRGNPGAAAAAAAAAGEEGDDDGNDDDLIAFIDKTASGRPSSVLLELKFPPPPPSAPPPDSGEAAAAAAAAAASAATTAAAEQPAMVVRRALYDFADGGDGSKVPLVAGEVVEVLQDGPEWTWVKLASTGAEGYVPTAYLEAAVAHKSHLFC